MTGLPHIQHSRNCFWSEHRQLAPGNHFGVGGKEEFPKTRCQGQRNGHGMEKDDMAQNGSCAMERIVVVCTLIKYAACIDGKGYVNIDGSNVSNTLL